MDLRRRIPFLRWSVLRIALGNYSLSKRGQIGDGRETAAADFVVSNARRGDIDDVLAKLDEYSYEKKMLISVGDKKGALLDAAVRRADPALALELGTYCGYSALVIARAAARTKVVSIELAEANAEVARRIWTHAGVPDRIVCVVGTIGDGGTTLDTLSREHGFRDDCLDFMFIDHAKHAYLPDLLSVEDRGWLAPGAIVVADNVLYPGSPKYRRFMREQQGKRWDTTEHKAHLEYQTLVPDLVLESKYLV
jgi:catechol O-methyltransferase